MAKLSYSLRSKLRRERSGFTMIEVLVSSAVLALLVVVLSSVFSNFVGLTSLSGKRIENNNQIGTVFDRVSFDLGSSIRKNGVQIDFLKNAQVSGGGDTVNDSMSFLTDVRSTSADARLARIAYQVQEDSNPITQKKFPSLYRAVDPFSWDQSTKDNTVTSNADWQPLGRGVFRFELSFLKTDGSIVSDPPAASDIAAVICSTVSLDEASLSKLTTSELNSLIGAFPDASDNVLPLSNWRVDNASFLPNFVRQNVRFNQRQFYLK